VGVCDIDGVLSCGGGIFEFKVAAHITAK